MKRNNTKGKGILRYKSEFKKLPIFKNRVIFIEAVVIGFYMLAVLLVSSKLGLNFLTLVVVLAGIPALYLSWRIQNLLLKTLLETTFFVLPSVVLMDYIAHVSFWWYEPSVIGLRVLGTFPIDSIIWTFIYVYFTLIAYSYFFDNNVKVRLNKDYRYVEYVLWAMLLVFIIVYFIDRGRLVMPGSYKYLAFFYIASTFVGLLVNKKIAFKVILFSLASAMFSFGYEFIAVSMRHWEFDETVGHIGYVSLSGVIIPYEELIWLMFFVPCLIIYHETFADNHK